MKISISYSVAGLTESLKVNELLRTHTTMCHVRSETDRVNLIEGITEARELNGTAYYHKHTSLDASRIIRKPS